jgi:hypothetical protein
MLLFVSTSVAFAQEEDDDETPRWRVKTLSDRDTIFVRFDTIIRSSIREQNRMAAADVSDKTRRLASETAVYEITALLVAVKRELDGDYHLVMRDPDSAAAMMVFEVPNPEGPAARATSRWTRYAQVKRTIDSLTFGSQRLLLERWLDAPIKLRFTGVGFYDGWHLIPQAGMAVNRRELHPVLSVDVLPDQEQHQNAHDHEVQGQPVNAMRAED